MKGAPETWRGGNEKRSRHHDLRDTPTVYLNDTPQSVCASQLWTEAIRHTAAEILLPTPLSCWRSLFRMWLSFSRKNRNKKRDKE